MSTAEIVETNCGQTVRLPADIRIEATLVSIRREGTSVILEPLKAAKWPAGFFDAIHIDDPSFVRPSRGATPAAPRFD